MKQVLGRARGALLRYGLSLAEQSTGSALSFIFNLWLIRDAASSAYGTYLLWTAVSLVMISVVNALTGTHLVPLPSDPEYWPQRRQAESILLAVTIWLLAITGLITLAIIGATRLWAHGASPWTGAAFLPAVMLYQYGRVLAFTRNEVRLAAAMTFSALVLSVSQLTLMHFTRAAFVPETLLLVQTLAYGLPALILVAGLSRDVPLDLRPRVLLGFRRFVGDSRWIVLGACCSEIMARTYTFIVAGMFGAAALSPLNAAATPLRPATLLVNSWAPVVRAELVKHRTNRDWPAFKSRLVNGLVGIGFVTILFTFMVWAAWPQISGVLYKGHYAGVAPVVIFWGINIAINGGSMTLATGLQAVASFRTIALAELAAAACVLAVVPTVLVLFPQAKYAVLAISIGPLVQAALMTRAYRATRRMILEGGE